MLVLTRLINQSIMVGDDCEIVVVDVRGDRVKLGVRAPAHVPVHRREVFEAIQREQGPDAPPAPGPAVSLDGALRMRLYLMNSGQEVPETLQLTSLSNYYAVSTATILSRITELRAEQ